MLYLPVGTNGPHSNRFRNTVRPHLFCLLGLALALSMPAAAGDKNDTDKKDIQQLKTLLADQQRQIQDLRAALQAQQKQMDRGAQSPAIPRLGEVASTTPMIPPAPAPAAKGAQYSETLLSG
jgi:hypothetical protein